MHGLESAHPDAGGDERGDDGLGRGVAEVRRDGAVGVVRGIRGTGSRDGAGGASSTTGGPGAPGCSISWT